MNFDELKSKVEQFIGKKPLDDGDMFGPQHLSHVAEQELSHCKGILHIDESNHTQSMKTEIIQSFRNKVIAWKHEGDDFIHQLEEIKAQCSSSKASKELAVLNHEMDDAKLQKQLSFTRDTAYNEEKQAKNNAEARYEKLLKQNSNRPPKIMVLWLYIPALLLVGLVEAFINFSTFNGYFGSEGLAYGSTIIVALIFAAASHFHGEFWKQRLELMGPDVEKRERRHELVVQLIVTVFFFLVFAGLMMVRYEVVLEQLSAVSVGGGLPGISLPGTEVAAEPSIWQKIMPTLLMNLGVWGLGGFVSYWMHDAKPFFEGAHRNYVKSRKKFNQLDSKLHDEYKQIEAKFSKKFKELQNTIEVEMVIVERINTLIGRINSEYLKIVEFYLIRVNDGLGTYRSTLVAIAKNNGFQEIKVGAHMISIDDYHKANINISNINFSA